MFTQPLMYQRIKQTKPVLEQYQKKILAEGVADQENMLMTSSVNMGLFWKKLMKVQRR